MSSILFNHLYSHKYIHDNIPLQIENPYINIIIIKNIQGLMKFPNKKQQNLGHLFCIQVQLS